jgi:hypothetical protein
LPSGLPCGWKGTDLSGPFSWLNRETYRKTLWDKEMTLAHPINEILGKQNNQSSYFFTENLSFLSNLPNSALIPRCSQVSGHPVGGGG